MNLPMSVSWLNQIPGAPPLPHCQTARLPDVFCTGGNQPANLKPSLIPPRLSAFPSARRRLAKSPRPFSRPRTRNRVMAKMRALPCLGLCPDDLVVDSSEVRPGRADDGFRHCKWLEAENNNPRTLRVPWGHVAGFQTHKCTLRLDQRAHRDNERAAYHASYSGLRRALSSTARPLSPCQTSPQLLRVCSQPHYGFSARLHAFF